MGMKRIVLIATLALSAAAGMAAEDRLALAEGLARRGMHAQALAEYEAFLKENQAGDAADDARFGLAACYEKVGRDAEARALYQALAGRLSGERQAVARLRLGLSFLYAADAPGEARPLLEMAATGQAAEEARQVALLNLGVCYARLDQGKAADSLFARVAAGKGPYAAQAKAAQAGRLLEQGQAAEAWARYREAIADAPEQAAPAFHAAFKAQAWPEAAAFAKAAGADRLGATGLLPAAYAALRAKRPDEAKAWLEAAKKASPAPTPDRLAVEGAVAEALGDVPGALAAHERLLAEFPKSAQAPAAAQAMLILRAKANDPAAFLKAHARVAALLTPEARGALAPLLLDAAIRADDAAQARAAAAWLMENADAAQAADAGYRLGWLEHRSGNAAQAGETWLRTAERWPAAPCAGQAAYAAATAFAAAKQPDRAERALALALASGDTAAAADALMLKARQALAENDAAGAAAALDEYLARFPKGRSAAEAAYLRGLVFFNAQDFAAAEAALGKALAPAEGEGGPTPLDHARRTDAALRRAQALHALGRGDEAAALLQPLVSLKDAQGLPPAYLGWLAEFRLGRKEWAEAEAVARVLAHREGAAADRALGNLLLGRAAEAQGQKATAIAAYEAALGDDDASPTAYDAPAAVGLGRLRADAGAHDHARAAFLTAIARADDSTEGRLARAQAYAGLAAACDALGLRDEALRASMSLIIFYDDKTLVPAAFRAAIANLRAQGRADEAETLRREFAQRYPDEARQTAE